MRLEKGDYYQRKAKAMDELHKTMTIARAEDNVIDAKTTVKYLSNKYCIGKKSIVEELEDLEKDFNKYIDWDSDKEGVV